MAAPPGPRLDRRRAFPLPWLRHVQAARHRLETKAGTTLSDDEQAAARRTLQAVRDLAVSREASGSRGAAGWWPTCGPISGSVRSAHAGSLLWHEKVHREAVGTTVSEFRHGQVEATGPGDAVLVLVPAGRSPDLQSYLGRLGRELGEIRVSVLWLDVAAQDPSMPPGLPPGGAYLLGALLRMQQLARGTARAAGTYVDGFHVPRQIVRAAPTRFD